jgi:DNA-binding GntR family transcriptional regulator
MKTAYVAAKLKRLLTAGRYLPGQRIPPAAGIARRLGASPVTVRKALRELVRTDVLSDAESGGYVVAGATPIADGGSLLGLTEEKGSAARVADLLREDILAHGADHPLPSAKELTNAIGCSHRTLRTALDTLQRIGMVRRRGSGYVTSVAGRRRTPQSAVYFVSDQPTLQSSSVQTLIMGMERELEALRWGQLRFIVSDGPSEHALPEDHQVAAYVHLSAGARSAWWDFLRRTASVSAVIVNLHETPATDRVHRPNLSIMTLDNQKAGRDIATHLAAMGHRRCAFFSDLTLTEGCAMLRLRGLHEVFASEPTRSTRTCRVFDTSDIPTEYSAPTDTLNEQLRGIEETAIRQSRMLPADVRHSLEGSFGLLFGWNRYRALEPVFADALRDRSITAWICSHDALATLAYTFLVNAGVAAANGPALASFDNLPASYSLGITSYDFAFDRVGRTVAQRLAAPHLIPTDRYNVVRTPGQLVTRATTTKPRSRPPAATQPAGRRA